MVGPGLLRRPAQGATGQGESGLCWTVECGVVVVVVVVVVVQCKIAITMLAIYTDTDTVPCPHPPRPNLLSPSVLLANTN